MSRSEERRVIGRQSVMPRDRVVRLAALPVQNLFNSGTALDRGLRTIK
jgi:hypothetical protein